MATRSPQPLSLTIIKTYGSSLTSWRIIQANFQCDLLNIRPSEIREVHGARARQKILLSCFQATTVLNEASLVQYSLLLQHAEISARSLGITSKWESVWLLCSRTLILRRKGDPSKFHAPAAEEGPLLGL
jgi:hypothetical protein